jgi:SAM-dependent methyltransferase
MADTVPDRTMDARYFDRMYAANPDPWDFAGSEYENAKYAATIEALDGRRFARGLEIGCSVGVLTARLAQQIDRLLAVDLSERALEQARRRCASLPNVAFERMAVPRRFPSGAFDFVLVSEVGYYWSRRDLALAIERIAAAAPGGTVELVHFLPKVRDYPRTGDEVHGAFLADERFRWRKGTRDRRYRLDVFDVAASANGGRAAEAG